MPQTPFFSGFLGIEGSGSNPLAHVGCKMATKPVFSGILAVFSPVIFCYVNRFYVTLCYTSVDLCSAFEQVGKLRECLATTAVFHRHLDLFRDR